jgi:putative heme-binding domain-containing protein
MTLDYEEQSNDELVKLLSYPDMRIRLKAQFALAGSTFWGYRKLKSVLEESPDQFARIHAIWGIGQIASQNLGKAEPLVALLSDKDPEIIAQALKVLGDINYSNAADHFIPLVQHENDRVKFYAAQALGRIEHEAAIQSLLDLIVANADEDVYLRHAAVLALSRIGKVEPIIALVDNDNRSLRIAAVLVLRRLQSPEVAKFLKDKDEYIVTEAARAINDDWSIKEALPALAQLLTQNQFKSEPLLRRSINAALRVGGEMAMRKLISFAKNPSFSSELRGEALAALGTWESPSVLDRVDGRLRGEVTRDGSLLKKELKQDIPLFLSDTNPEILIGVAKTLANLDMNDNNKEVYSVFSKNKSPEVRAAMLTALGKLQYEDIETAMKAGMGDREQMVREAAVGLIAELDISKDDLPSVVNPIFRTGSVREQQRILGVLADMPVEKSENVLKNLIQRAGKNQLKDGVILDLIEATEATKSDNLIALLGVLKGGAASVDAYQETLFGGNRRGGRNVFNNNPTAQCVRCHAQGGTGGLVGPPLDNIGNILTREQLLESLIEPSARLAPGYGTITVTLKDGQTATGILVKETKHDLILRTSDAEPLEIAKSRILKRENSISAMPAMGRLITKRELRNLIEYLSSLRKE